MSRERIQQRTCDEAADKDNSSRPCNSFLALHLGQSELTHTSQILIEFNWGTKTRLVLRLTETKKNRFHCIV